MGTAAIGAVIGLAIGIALSIYVARLDQQKVQRGVRSRPQYRLSLFGVPVILALLGGMVGGIFGS